MCWTSVYSSDLQHLSRMLITSTEKLSAIVRSLQLNDPRHLASSVQNNTVLRNYQIGSQHQDTHDEGDNTSRVHTRNESSGTDGTSGEESTDARGATARRHDFNVHAMETATVSSRPRASKSPISPPTVLIRSEYPTLNRSRQHQSLTCIVTVEVPWQPDVEMLRSFPPIQSVADDHMGGYAPLLTSKIMPGRPGTTAGELDQMTEDLHSRVDNWHGLDFSRYGVRSSVPAAHSLT